jgi:hypothetical protein
MKTLGMKKDVTGDSLRLSNRTAETVSVLVESQPLVNIGAEARTSNRLVQGERI